MLVRFEPHEFDRTIEKPLSEQRAHEIPPTPYRPGKAYSVHLVSPGADPRSVEPTVEIRHACLGASPRSLFCATCKRLLEPGALKGVAFAYPYGRAAFHGSTPNEKIDKGFEEAGGGGPARADAAASIAS